MRIGIFLILLFAISVFFASSAFVSERSLQGSSKDKFHNKAPRVAERTALPANLGARQITAGIPTLSLMPLFPQFPSGPPAPNPEIITIYESDCTTESTSFTLGQTVCAKVEGMPVSPAGQRRVEFVSSSNFVLASADVINNGQTLLFTLPTDATENQGGLTVDNRGTWYVTGSATSDSSVRVRTGFSVSDPAQQVANLGIYKYVAGTEQIAPGGVVTFTFQAVNQGPDAATNVVITDVVPTGTTFLLETQETGPTFTCTNPTVGSTGTTSCTIASLPSGADAEFRVRYTVNAGATNGTPIQNTANISSATVERLSADNTYTAEGVVKTGGGGTGDICSVNCPEDITKQADTVDGSNNPGSIVHFTPPSGNAECGTILVSHCNDCFFPVGSTTVTATAASGETCEFIVTVTPANSGGTTISCPANQTTNAENDCAKAVAVGTPTANGTNVTLFAVRNDGKAMYTCDGNGNCTRVVTDFRFPAGVTTITWSATSHSAAGPYTSEGQEVSLRTGNASCTQTITVNDTEAPTITASAQTGSADASCQAAIPDFTTSATVTDNCACSGSDTSESCEGREIITVTQSPAPGTMVGLGTYTITLTANDGSSNNNGAGNTATTTITFTVSDTTAPTVTAPADSSANADASCMAPVPNYAAGSSASDNCDSSVTLTQSPAAGTAVGLGPHTVTVTGTDDAGNQATDTVVFTVNDVTKPTITLNGPNPQYVECHTSYTENGATANDNCDGSFAATPSGSVDANTVGTYTITYNASDASGNAATPVTRTVIVRDTIAPTITLNGANPQYVECHTSYPEQGAIANDSCTGSFAATASGSVNVNVVGTYTITYNASDASGNAATPVTRTVIVQDTIAPTITLNGQTPSMWPPNHKYQTFQVTNFVTGVTDSCNTTLGVGSVVIEKVTSDEIENGNGDGNTLNDIVIAANCKSVQLRSEREGYSNGRVYTITFKVSDGFNTTRVTAKVVVPHNPGETPVDSGVHYTVNGSCP